MNQVSAEAADANPARAGRREAGLRSDEELIQASVTDPEAFAALYKRHASQLIAFFYRRTACPEASADLTSETFAAAYIAARRYRITSSPAAAWLYGIARHQLSRYIRREKVDARARSRLGVVSLDMSEDDMARIEEIADAASLQDQLDSAMKQLPTATADAVRLRVSRQMPYSQVATELGCSEVAARVRVARGLTRLTEIMEVKGE